MANSKKQFLGLSNHFLFIIKIISRSSFPIIITYFFLCIMYVLVPMYIRTLYRHLWKFTKPTCFNFHKLSKLYIRTIKIQILSIPFKYLHIHVSIDYFVRISINNKEWKLILHFWNKLFFRSKWREEFFFIFCIKSYRYSYILLLSYLRPCITYIIFLKQLEQSLKSPCIVEDIYAQSFR